MNHRAHKWYACYINQENRANRVIYNNDNTACIIASLCLHLLQLDRWKITPKQQSPFVPESYFS